MEIIDAFGGKYFFLCNFYPKKFLLDENVWKTVEHYFQANKAIPTDIKGFEEIRDTITPNSAKDLGQKISLRSDWEETKYNIMKKAVYAKFSQNIEIKKKLLNTEDAILIEGNYHHDNIWGDCYCHNCASIKGTNWLGKILMEVRNELSIENNYVIDWKTTKIKDIIKLEEESLKDIQKNRPDWINTKYEVPFGMGNDRWNKFKEQIKENDELWNFTSPDMTWHQLCGREGYFILRKNRVVDIFITKMS